MGEGHRDVVAEFLEALDHEAVREARRDDLRHGLLEGDQRLRLVSRATVVVEPVVIDERLALEIGVVPDRRLLVVERVEHAEDRMGLVDQHMAARPEQPRRDREEGVEVGHPTERADGDVDQIETGVVLGRDVGHVALHEVAVDAGHLGDPARLGDELVRQVEADAARRADVLDRDQLAPVVAAKLRDVAPGDADLVQIARLDLVEARVPGRLERGEQVVEVLLGVQRRRLVPARAVGGDDLFAAQAHVRDAQARWIRSQASCRASVEVA